MTSSSSSGLSLEPLTGLDPATVALLGFAAEIALGQDAGLEAAARTLLETGAPPPWADELLLQSVLMVGWPRALVAAATWRRVAGPAVAPGEDGTAYRRHPDWLERGEAVCRVVYGESYERLRANVRALHPALEAWMVTDGYGRTLGRSGLDLARRELCIVAQVAVQGAERQLHSHVRGALRAGASPEVLEAVVRLLAPRLGPKERATLGAVWDKVRASQEERA